MIPSRTTCVGLYLYIFITGLVVAPSTLAVEAVDLLSNGGFEQGLAGWNAAPAHAIVTEEGAAHSGMKCLSGEVTRPDQALILRRPVPVRAGNRYEFEIWARATNRTKLVLWVVPPGSSTRQMVASWKSVPRRWRRYATPLTVERDGTLGLEIVAPSSHGEPPGKIWIDDIALHETSMPPLFAVSRGVGFNDEPALALAADGSVVVAWNSFREGADALRAAWLERRGESFVPRGEWSIIGGEGTYVLGVEAVAAGGVVAVLYAAETDGVWDIHTVQCSRDGPGKQIAVTSRRSVDVKPVGAWHEGTLWIAWESNLNGVRQVFATSVRGETVSEPVPVSSREGSSYDPSIAVLPDGEVCVSWHSFRRNNYDIYLRRRARSGTWGPELRLTRAPTIDRHPLLFTRESELWLAYENAEVVGYRIGATNLRRLVVARVSRRGLLAPKHDADGSPLEARSEAASAAFDARGRLWLTHLRPRLPRAGWDVFLTSHSGGRWQPAVPLSTRKGMDRRPRLVLAEGRGIVAFQADTMPGSWSDVDRTSGATSDIYLTTFDTESAPPATAIQLEPLVESKQPFEAGALRIARGEELPGSSINYRGRSLKLFFGDLHEHSDISVCNRNGDQSVNESYQHMRDIVALDFACITDHGYNLNPYLWSYTAKFARVNDDQGRFLTFLAEEWTSSFEKYDARHPYGYYGHRNLILSDLYFPRWWNARNGQTPAQVWEELRKLGADFVHIPHQLADTGNVPTDWDYTDEEAQPVAEIFQVRGSYEHRGAPREAQRTTPAPGYFLQDAWARGIVIGVIASPDHGGGLGKACVYASELTREAILEGLRSRHCYGTSGARITLDVRVNGYLMGEKRAEEAGASVKVEIRVRCPGDIERVEVCRNNHFIYVNHPAGRSAELTLTDREPLKGRSYYYVRVVQTDEEIAWSSPVWFGTK